MLKPLFLGSKSQSRQMLLRQTEIPFLVVGQDADEAQCDWGLSLQKVVEQIARFKMDHVVLPEGCDDEVRFVLTADTLTRDSHGNLLGKANSLDDARNKIKAVRAGKVRTGTAFCLDRVVWRSGMWKHEARIEQFVDAEYSFIIPDEWIDVYLSKSFILSCSGAIAIEEYGAQFFKDITGSYTTIVGLPMFELRQALEMIGFFAGRT